jgi:type I restriction enzyme, R subunit
MESERQTRKRRIDPLLKSLGWKVVPFDEQRSLAGLSNCAIEEFPTENGPADYVLCLDGRIVGVVEAIERARHNKEGSPAHAGALRRV